MSVKRAAMPKVRYRGFVERLPEVTALVICVVCSKHSWAGTDLLVLHTVVT